MEVSKANLSLLTIYDAKWISINQIQSGSPQDSQHIVSICNLTTPPQSVQLFITLPNNTFPHHIPLVAGQGDGQRVKSVQLQPNNRSLDFRAHIKARGSHMNVCSTFVSTKVGSRVGNSLKNLDQAAQHTQLQRDCLHQRGNTGHLKVFC